MGLESQTLSSKQGSYLLSYFWTFYHKTINDCNLPFLVVRINNAGFLEKNVNSVFSYNWNKHTNMDNRLYFVPVVYMVVLIIVNGKLYFKVPLRKWFAKRRKLFTRQNTETYINFPFRIFSNTWHFSPKSK